ncbi:lipid-binding SYLF domain-containing protein [Massilia sp. MS-15]|uniref:lipid-binding SYLF domain-containing protein n=1 Tax=Massilia sp. MS-15 TaxID=2878200 RepID=UPI001CD7EBC0|nr:lipid-binding SYLF domain-containing protein [Massilia sp. MS-15]MCA1247956.1 lipid-binding SYLF domain-containing protein [Massilia sp. MS-15]
MSTAFQHAGLSRLATILLASSPAAAGQESGAQLRQAAVRLLADAAGVAHTMSRAPGLAALIGSARGVYIVPACDHAGPAVGAGSGSGVLVLRRRDGHWGNPAFYTTGGISIGLQAGGEAGPFALLLMNQKAVDHVRKRNNFSLRADAGLTVVNYARMAQGTTGGDVVAWSGAKGLFGNAATIAVDDIRYNQRLTQAHYGKPVNALDALDGSPQDPQAEPLRTALGERAEAVSAPDR